MATHSRIILQVSNTLTCWIGDKVILLIQPVNEYARKKFRSWESSSGGTWSRTALMIYRGLSIFMRPLLEAYIEAGIRFENSLLRRYGFADDDRKYMDYDNLRQKGADVTFWTQRLLENTSGGYTKLLKLEVSHLEDLASLLDIIAPAIRILLTPHFLDLIIQADDEMRDSFELELAHGLCKDADILDSFGTGVDSTSRRVTDGREAEIK